MEQELEERDGWIRSPATTERKPASGEKKRTSSEHFSPLANVSLPASQFPDCYVPTCDIRANGADIIESMGRALVARFACPAHGRPFRPISSSAVHPQWEILSRRDRGIFVMRKRSRKEQLEVVKRRVS